MPHIGVAVPLAGARFWVRVWVREWVRGEGEPEKSVPSSAKIASLNKEKGKTRSREGRINRWGGGKHHILWVW